MRRVAICLMMLLCGLIGWLALDGRGGLLGCLVPAWRAECQARHQHQRRDAERKALEDVEREMRNLSLAGRAQP